MTPASVRRVEPRLATALRRADAFVMSDYGRGLDHAGVVAARAGGRDGRSAPPVVLVDSRYALGGFTGMTACTPNESEVEALLGIRIDDNREVLERRWPHLLETPELPRRARLRAAAAAWRCSNRAVRPITSPIVGSDQVTDVTGAGDTVIADVRPGAGGRRAPSARRPAWRITPAASS